MKTQLDHTKRWYWLDWTRVLAINMVMLYHTIEAVLHYRKKGQIAEELNTIRTYMQSVGLPLFFTISGMVKGLKTTQYTINIRRIQYLIIPLLISTILFLIPSRYLLSKVLHLENGTLIQFNGDCSVFRGNQIIPLIQFELFYFWKDCFGHIGFAWLWFLPVLTMLEIISYPFITLIEALISNKPVLRKKELWFIHVTALLSVIYYGQLRWTKQLYFILVIVTTHYLLLAGIKLYYAPNKHKVCIKMIWFTIFIFGVLPAGMVLSIGVLNAKHFRFEELEFEAFDHAIDYDITYLYFWMFHLFGVVFTKVVYVEVMRHGVESQFAEILNWCKIVCYQCGILLLFISTSIRTMKHDRAYTFVNILQEPDAYQRVMFVVMCWVLLYLVCMTSKYTMGNAFYDVRNEHRAQIVYKSSLIVYCSHGLWIACLTFWWYDGTRNYEAFTSRSHIFCIYMTTMVVAYSCAFAVVKIHNIAKFFDLHSKPTIYFMGYPP
eukprot:436021_1